MRAQRSILLLGLPALLTLSGCGYVHFGRGIPTPAATTFPAALPVARPASGDAKLTQENTDLRLEKKMLQQELAIVRAQGEALRMTIENRAADGDTSSKLVERLNQTSRELAALRANYAQLQTERNQAVASATEANALRTRLGATEEKLAESLRTYTTLQGEVTRLRTDVDRTRAENVVLTEKVKVVTAQNEEAQAALAQLNTELLSQKGARLAAEQDVATLRTELAHVAPNASVLAQQRTGAAAAANALVAEHAAETAALKQQLGELRSKVASLSAERTALQDQLPATEAGSRGPSPELANAEVRLAHALRNASLLRDENEQLKATGPQVQSLRQQLDSVQAQATALAEENARLKSKLPTASAPPEAKPILVIPAAESRPVVRISDLTGGSVNATLVTNIPAAQRVQSGAEDTGGTRVHVVAGGDTLAKISALYYGTPGRWGEILAANREVLGETNNLVVGRTLKIP